MHTKSFLLIVVLALCSAGSKTHPGKRLPANHTATGRTVLLEYTGSLSSIYANFTIGAQLSLDTSIGFRYDITFEKGDKVLSHDAVFYKFSNPHQTIFYNYLNHKKEVNQEKPGDPNNNVTVVGKEIIDSFSCTHLQHQSSQGSEDYWMSKSVPGFSQLSQVLNHLDAGLMASLNETIFNWGGLVRIRMVDTAPGAQTTMVLNLIEAETDVLFQRNTFEVPTK
jgi:hypothetical protein